MIASERLFLETKETEGIMSRSQILPREWDSTGIQNRCCLLLFMNNLLTLSLFLLKSEIYGKVVVASKVPLPNYRPDLDDKRPQREVKAKTIKLFFL